MATEVDPLRKLEQFVAKHQNQKEAAAALDISQPYLCDLLRERRALSVELLAKLGLKRAVVQK